MCWGFERSELLLFVHGSLSMIAMPAAIPLPTPPHSEPNIIYESILDFVVYTQKQLSSRSFYFLGLSLTYYSKLYRSRLTLTSDFASEWVEHDWLGLAHYWFCVSLSFANICIAQIIYSCVSIIYLRGLYRKAIQLRIPMCVVLCFNLFWLGCMHIFLAW